MRATFIITVLNAALSGSALAAGGPTTICESDDATFTMTVLAGNDDQSCEAQAASGNGALEAVWISHSDAGLCQRKAESLFDLLADAGWDCDETELTLASRDE